MGSQTVTNQRLKNPLRTNCCLGRLKGRLKLRVPKLAIKRGRSKHRQSSGSGDTPPTKSFKTSAEATATSRAHGHSTSRTSQLVSRPHTTTSSHWQSTSATDVYPGQMSTPTCANQEHMTFTSLPPPTHTIASPTMAQYAPGSSPNSWGAPSCLDGARES